MDPDYLKPGCGTRAALVAGLWRGPWPVLRGTGCCQLATFTTK